MAALTLAACNGSGSTSASTARATSTTIRTAPAPFSSTTLAPVSTTNAGTLLAILVVRPSAGLTGYNRAQFGVAWADVDHNGCDTRNDILNRDLTERSWRAGTHDCVVVAGSLADPYSGTMIAFTKAKATAIQIDHLVPLANAWSTGAKGWSASRREQFANDPLELLAVSGPLNEAKSDKDASQWLPPNTAFDCTYVTRQVEVKATYGLWVTPAEHTAMAAVLARCG